MGNGRRTCRISELLRAPIFTRETGRNLGSVQDVIFDPRAGKLEAVTIERPGFFGSHRRYLLANDMLVIGEDAIMVRNGAVLKRGDTAPRERAIVEQGITLTGKRIVTEDGTILGEISDVIIDPDTGQAERYEVSGGAFKDVQAGRRTFPVPEALVVGPDAIVVPPQVEYEMEAQEPGGLQAAYEETRTGAAGFWQRTKDWWRREAGRAAAITEQEEVEFVRGKVAGSTVKDDFGNVIVDEGETITDRTIVLARAANKMHQLALAAGWGSTKRGYEAAKDRVSEAGRGAVRAGREREEEYALGKRAGSTVRDDEGSVIVWKDDVISQEDVDQAREAGKLEALFAAATYGEAREAGRRVSETAGGAREEADRRRLTAEQREIARGKISATDIVDREGSLVIREGEIFTPMILDHLEEEGLLDQIRLKPVMGAERAPSEEVVPRIELIVKTEEVEHR